GSRTATGGCAPRACPNGVWSTREPCGPSASRPTWSPRSAPETAGSGSVALVVGRVRRMGVRRLVGGDDDAARQQRCGERNGEEDAFHSLDSLLLVEQPLRPS